MINIKDFISNIPSFLQKEKYIFPWEIISDIKEIIERIIPNLGVDFKIENGIAVHKTAILEHGITLKSPTIIMDKCHVGANAYFREGVFLDSSVKIGPCSEIKSSIIFSDTSIAHLSGALNLPTWIVLQKLPDWRWGVDSNSSDWYQNVRIFRQQEQENWTSVFDEVCASLKDVMSWDKKNGR